MLSNIKNILVGITYNTTDEDKPSSALAYGLSLARQAGAHITAQSASIRLVMPHALVSNVAAGLVATENQRLAALAKVAADNARGAADLAGVACTTETLQLSYSDLVVSFIARARVHDLTVLDSEPVAVSTERGLIETALFESGRPVIIVPDGVTEFSAGRVLVAWDGSARAARAVNDALPFLRAAKEVEIVSVQGEKDLTTSVAGVDLAAHLANHGVAVTVTNLALEGRDAAETLRRHAANNGFDLIVMGAFVHSWVRQMVLGGVTHSLLNASPVPLFLSY